MKIIFTYWYRIGYLLGMLNEKAEPMGLLKAYYSEQRNDACVRYERDSMISLHVTKDARIIAATEIKENKKPPIFDSNEVGEVYTRPMRIGNYQADAKGLIGRISIRDFRYLMERDLMDSPEEMLALYNPMDETKAKQDLAKRVEKLKAYMGNFLKPGDYIPAENKYIAQKEDVVTPSKKDDGSVPIPESWWQTFAIHAEMKKRYG